MIFNGFKPLSRGSMLLCLLALAACAQAPTPSESQIAPNRLAFSMQEAKAVQSSGGRVWCVPFARNLSGVDLYGNARTWWHQAQGTFAVSSKPAIGSVMAFDATSSMPQGHVAVVSEVVSERKVLVDHANWHRNQISLGMAVIDVSKKNDWSRVRVESVPGTFGSVYPVKGFILPNG